MSPRQHFGRYGIALLALFLTAAGAPAMACGAMVDCPMPMPVPEAECHATTGAADGCAPPQVEAAEGCCCVMAAQPVSAAPSGASAPGPAISAPGPAAPSLPAVAAGRPLPAGEPPPCRPAGRALLSLQQTLLI